MESWKLALALLGPATACVSDDPGSERADNGESDADTDTETQTLRTRTTSSKV